jgi:predicted metal-dependent hydrolase
MEDAKSKPSEVQLANLSRIVPAELLDDFCTGLSEFNSGLYFECHETLEDVWRKQEGEERELTQGIIQIAVGCHHLSHNNKVGALKLFRRGLPRIEKFKNEETGLCLTDLCSQVQNLISVHQAGENASDNFSHPSLCFK